ncbi:hypothetical protein [Tenacibaculum sp. 190524A05c]|uniref:hypothetical protein n=1 Tax=Tenacibaculum platacis TaxID=3137852 RepID=UPI0032B2112D
MEFKFTMNPYNQEGINNFFGVDYDSLKDDEKSLLEIAWDGWTVSEVNKIINKTKVLEGEDFFDYIVEGSELRISIDNEYVLFFDWRTESTEDDFRWSTAKFLNFMKSFRDFLKENGR